MTRRGVAAGATILAAIAGVLAVPLAAGPASARVGALFGLAGLAGGLAAAMRAQRLEHLDDAEPPSTMALLARGADVPVVISIGILAYLLVMVVAFGSDGGIADRPGWQRGLLSSAAALGLVTAIVVSVLGVLAKEGVERKVSVEAAGLAFIVTVLGAAVYGIVEVVGGAPRVSMWWVWSLGAVTFWVGGIVLRRRAT